MSRKILSLAFLFAASCSKKSESNNQPILTGTLSGKYWVCDSVNTTQNGSSQTTVVGKGKGLDVVYNATGTYTIYANPSFDKNYLQKNDTVYYWNIGASMNANAYFLIKSLTTSKLVTYQKDLTTGKELTNYNHAE